MINMCNMCHLVCVLTTTILLASVHGYSPPVAIGTGGLKPNSTSRTTTATEAYNWAPQKAGDTLWFMTNTTNDTGIPLLITYKGHRGNYLHFTPSFYNITEKNVWHRVIYKVEPRNYITICPDHNFDASYTYKDSNLELGFKHSTGKVKWSTTVPDFKKAIQINAADITLFTGENNENEGPEKLFGVPGKWKPTGLGKNYNNWSVTVDLKKIYTLTKVSLKLQGKASDVKSFKLELSENSGSMKEVFSVSNVRTGVTDTQPFALPEGSSGRFCRFTVTETGSGDAPMIQDLSLYGFVECRTSSNEEESRIVNGGTTEISTTVSTNNSTWHCKQNETTSCHKPIRTNDKICTTNHIEVCEDTLVCENITKKICTSSTNSEAESVCSDSSETKCKTSTKAFFDEEGCATLLIGKQSGSSGLITSIVFNIILIVIVVVLAVILYCQTGCICNKHNYRKQSLLVGPPTHPPTPPPLMNPVLNRIAGNGMINPRQSDHLYDSPYELPPEDLELRHPREDSHPGNRTTRRGSAHDSVNSFYAALNTNIVENNH